MRSQSACPRVVMVLFALAAFVMFGSHRASAQTVVGTSSNTTYVNPLTGNTDTAQAVFTLYQGNLGVTGSNSYLQVTLTNTSTYSTGWHNADLLTGVLFQLNTTTTGPSASGYSAVTSLGLVNPSKCDASYVTTCTTGPVDVSSQWLFQKSTAGFAWTGGSGCPASGTITTAQYGIVTSQYSCLNPNFGGSGKSFVEPNQPTLYSKNNQLAFGIVGANYQGSASDSPYERTSVTFDIALAGTVTTLKVSKVMFTYGTGPDGLAVPEPGALAVFGSGLALVGLVRRGRHRRDIR